MPVSVVLGPEARALRRRIGPTAWCLLEELLSIADAGFVVVTTVRDLAARVGLGRDAVAAGLRRLREESLVVFEAPRAPVVGRFGAGRYTVSPAVVGDLVVTVRDTRVGVECPGRRGVGRRAQDEQLAFAVDGVEEPIGEVGRVAAQNGAAGSVGMSDGQAVGADRVGPAVRPSEAEGRGDGHELASQMRPASGDIRGDIGRGGRRC